MSRRTSEETRRLLIDAGLQLLLERGVSAGVQHIRLQEVLRRVGLTTGAAYRIWAEQDEYHRDLAVEMVRLRLAPPTASAQAAVSGLIGTDGTDGTIDDVIRAAAADHVAYVETFHLDPGSRASHAFLTALSLRTAAGAWPELRVASAARHAESVDEFVRFYSALMRRYGLRMRTPYSVEDFAEAMAALGEGFAIRAAEGLSHPMMTIAEADEGPTGEWSLFAIAIRGLMDAFMVSASEAAPLASDAEAVPSRAEDSTATRDR